MPANHVPGVDAFLRESASRVVAHCQALLNETGLSEADRARLLAIRDKAIQQLRECGV
jgi:hypothetical protein